MDSMNHRRDENIAAIIDGMKKKNVDLMAMRSRILEILGQEYLVPVDKRMVDIDILEEMLAHIESRLDLDRNRPAAPSFASIQSEIDRREKRKRMEERSLRFIKRAAVATPLVLVLMFAANNVLTYRETVVDQTGDNEQAIIQQIVHDPGFVGTGIAGNKSLEYALSETEIDGIIEIFGYMPSTPTWLPENWSVSSYEASASVLWKTLFTMYRIGDEDCWIKFTYREHNDIDTAKGYLEETGEGFTFPLANGITLYLTQNTDNLAGAWIDGTKQYTILGPITSEDMIHMANSIYNLEVQSK